MYHALPHPDRTALAALFPHLALREGVEFRLAELVQRVLARGEPFNVHNPQHIQKLVDDLHTRSEAAYSYGGWMEDRGSVFSDTYMAAEERYIHLGVDVNLPAGTEVRLPCAGSVQVSVSDDQEIGWGARVDLFLPDRPYVLMLGHLDPDLLVTTTVSCLPAGTVVGVLGAPPRNGNVFPHLHLQAVRREVYDGDPLLDGYGLRSHLARLPVDFPNPFEILAKR